LFVGTERPYERYALVLTAVHVSKEANINVNINKVIQLNHISLTCAGIRLSHQDVCLPCQYHRTW